MFDVKMHFANLDVSELRLRMVTILKSVRFLGLVLNPMILICTMGWVNPADAAVAAVTTPEIYRSRKLNFEIVSPGNCVKAADGDQTGCVFPRIHLQEPASGLPPLPYETRLEFKTTSECRGKINAADGSLQLRLSKFPTDETFVERRDVLTFANTQVVLVTDTQWRPYKELVLAPRSSRIFSAAVFPAGCKVSVELEMNRLAFSNNAQASRYLNSMEQQFELVRQLNTSLKALHRARDEQSRAFRVAEHYESMVGRQHGQMDACQRQWRGLQGLARDLEANMRVNPLLAADPKLQALTLSLLGFSRSFERMAGEADPSRREAFPEAQEWDSEMRELLDPDRLRAVELKLEGQRQELEVARRTFERQRPVGDYSRVLDDLRDCCTDEICAPQGVIDSILCGLRDVKCTSR